MNHAPRCLLVGLAGLFVAMGSALGQSNTNQAPFGSQTNLLATTNPAVALLLQRTNDQSHVHLKVDPMLHETPPVPQAEVPGIAGEVRHVLKDFFGIGQVVHIFNGKDLQNFYPWLRRKGTYIDPDKAFRVEDGMIHITGQGQGFIVTKTEYSDYRLVVEYKWGKQSWYANPKVLPNSGIYIHGVGPDGIDIKSIEVQMQRGNNTGNIVLHGGATLLVGNQFKNKPWNEFNNPDAAKFEKLNDWNRLEVFAEGNRLRILLNGHLTVEGSQATPTRGKILLQCNGAEILFRRVDLYDMSRTNSLPGLLPSITGDDQSTNRP